VGLKPISVANWLLLVLWCCWLGQLTCKIVPEMTYKVTVTSLPFFCKIWKGKLNHFGLGEKRTEWKRLWTFWYVCLAVNRSICCFFYFSYVRVVAVCSICSILAFFLSIYLLLHSHQCHWHNDCLLLSAILTVNIIYDNNNNYIRCVCICVSHLSIDHSICRVYFYLKL